MGRLLVIVLGSAAGGGVPQWNCGCRVCSLARAGDARVRTRAQTSVAVSADGIAWVLLNASPDLRGQIIACPRLWPTEGGRGTPVKAVVLTGAEIDQVAGLLHLREGEPFTLYAAEETLAILNANPIFDALAPGLVERCAVPLRSPVKLAEDMTLELFPVPGKPPLYLEREAGSAAECGTVGLDISVAGRRLAFVPGIAEITPGIRARLAGADIVLLDGTLFTDDEMIKAELGKKTGRRMGHAPITGEGGSLDALSDVAIGRRIFIHVNNTNPILVEDSPERRLVEQAGWEVAFDGQEIVL